MKKSAKLLSAVMAGAMVLSMAGCGSSSNSTETTAASAETTAAAADSSAAESKEGDFKHRRNRNKAWYDRKRAGQFPGMC